MVSVLSVLRQLLGTFVALIGGWLAGVLCTAVIAFGGIGGAQREEAVGATLATAIFMWIYLVPVWVVALIPLYLLVPRSSALWRPYICVSLGAVGGLASVALFAGGYMDSSMFTWYAVAAVVGAATCLTGVLTRDRFKV
jgi:hypothetical protein